MLKTQPAAPFKLPSLQLTNRKNTNKPTTWNSGAFFLKVLILTKNLNADRTLPNSTNSIFVKLRKTQRLKLEETLPAPPFGREGFSVLGL